MTDIQPAASTDVVEGMEDFDESDMAMPRIKIDHGTATYQDSLSNQAYAELNVVLLGLVKQRILWPAEMGEEKSAPLCKSVNFVEGRPDVANFPWDKSGFDAPPAGSTDIALPCDDCQLKEWGSNPKNDTPWCSEQYTFAALMPINGDIDFGATPVVLTVQRSAIKPCKRYLTSFARARTPLYTCFTSMTLEARKKGTVNFAVPKLVKGAETPTALWPEFAAQYRSIRDFLQSERSDQDETPSSTAAASAPDPASSARADEDEDLPF